MLNWSEIKAQIDGGKNADSPLTIIEEALSDDVAPFECVDQRLEAMITELALAFKHSTTPQP